MEVGGSGEPKRHTAIQATTGEYNLLIFLGHIILSFDIIYM